MLAQVESQTTLQQLEIATHEYVVALSDLRIQLGIPEYAASAVPDDEMTLPAGTLPGDDEALVRMAVCSRPEILAAQAAACGARDAVALRVPTGFRFPPPGPPMKRTNRACAFYGFTVTMPMPVLNAGGPLVRQREAEYQRASVVLAQLRQRAATQVRATLVKWHDSQDLVCRTQALVEPIRNHTTPHGTPLRRGRDRRHQAASGAAAALGDREWPARFPLGGDAELRRLARRRRHISLLGGLSPDAEAIPRPGSS